MNDVILAIEKAVKNNEIELDLGNTGITELPRQIGLAKSLKRLFLNGNHLSKLPPEIGELNNLEYLNLHRNNLFSLPSEINQLQNLNVLILSFNPIDHLPPKFSQLKNLQLLDLRVNRFLQIPNELKKMVWLNTLLLSSNPFEGTPDIKPFVNLEYIRLNGLGIEEFPNDVIKLKKLKALSLHSNKIKSIPDSISELKNLEAINFDNNKIEKIPKSIIRLSKLRELSFANNKLTSLDIGIGQLSNLEIINISENNISLLPDDITKLHKLNMLLLKGNDLPIPPEILGKNKDPQTILNYYFSLLEIKVSETISVKDEISVRKEQKGKQLNELKLILVGQGSVGKTSLVQQIIDGTFDQNQTKTEGISISQWQVTGSQKRESKGQSEIENRKSEIRLNIWDFGGQEIMHATHQFFLTKRSLYLLVLDARLTQEENRVEYWLKIIESFGGESPVLIVGNKTDQHPLDIDRTGLQKKYPNIVGILETSAATGKGIEELKAEIAKQVDTLPHVRDLLPETWFTVKSKLEELGRDKNFITQDEYLGLCGANDVTDETSQHTLIGFLHDLGVVLHFQDDPRLEALGILNPQWVTNGVYKILNSHELFQNQGTLTLPILNKTLIPPEYPSNKRLFIVDMMKKFELCYDIEPDKSFLIPDLLPKDEPFTGEWDGALAFQYHYNVLPTSIISRFIVRMNPFVHKTVWRSGVVLKSSGNTALVKADTEDRKIYISVNGDQNTRRDFLYAIRMEFDAIHKTIAKIEATEKVPLPSQPGVAPVDYEFLLRLERDNRPSFPVQAGNDIIDVDVKELLDGVRPSKNQAVKVFISYGHEDKSFVKKLTSELGKDSIESWWDFDALKGGQSWQKEIQQGIKRSDFFIVVLSPNSVERDWVLKEITFANEYKKKIIPLLLKKCERPISIIEKQYIDFENQTQKAAIKELLGILKYE